MGNLVLVDMTQKLNKTKGQKNEISKKSFTQDEDIIACFKLSYYFLSRSRLRVCRRGKQ